LVRHAESVVPSAGGPDEFRRPLTAAGSARAERLVGELALTGAVVVVSRPGGESLAQLTERATSALADQHTGATVVVGSHGTFVARALVGFGVAGVDWEFSRAMPMPAVYRLRFTTTGVAVSGQLSR